MTPRTVVSTVAIAGVLALGVAVGSAQQTGTDDQSTSPRQNMMELQRTMGQMRSMQQNMMSTMNADNARLNDLLAKVESAQGQARTDAMVDLLKALVEQQQQMHHQQMQMRGQMMSGMNMMSQMMGGTMGGGNNGMMGGMPDGQGR